MRASLIARCRRTCSWICANDYHVRSAIRAVEHFRGFAAMFTARVAVAWLITRCA